ncbi:DnaJ domain-containing protein [Pseudobacteroides cellulosolvens]|uniref:Heat shock protein DnaJ domain protein n=1 Tax=Pseudobacteroides cellulosolvens ATCC 35603 = DSM 2933 TaxID=398512 RepID=A0A0L6JNE5_9FIRM|nr:DnaJ domain-containing protein [Pseudobacteroides cellulosolvens]KNY27336.1 heat shock protein DnaJ domain protein [Pseudobacteroides cellulosolvens ATCC 35603 = DSM 2933]
MYKDLDLYRLLQVQDNAEPEVIAAAYKRLSKKYHPDLNRDKGAEEKMMQINYAFSILSDVEKRKQYDVHQRIKHIENSSIPYLMNYPKEQQREILKALKVVKGYFACLSIGKFYDAYDKISFYDKNKVTLFDFVNWQNKVSQYFEIVEVQVSYNDYYDTKKVFGQEICKVFEFSVIIHEKEILKDSINIVNINRLVVLNRDKYEIILGYEDLRTETNKLLMSMEDKKGEYEALSIDYDELDKYFKEYVDLEFQKNKSYNRPFSIISINFICDISINCLDEVFSLITGALRGSDKFIPISEDRAVILLPETGPSGADKATHKIADILNGYAESKGWKFRWFKIKIIKSTN